MSIFICVFPTYWNTLVYLSSLCVLLHSSLTSYLFFGNSWNDTLSVYNYLHWYCSIL
jgi:hypothetical protein